MDAAQFRLPVRLLMKEDEDIREVYSAEEALEILLAWPRQSGRVYDSAVSACLAATVAPDSTQEAQRAFIAFARASGILARDMLPAPARRGAMRGGFRPTFAANANFRA
ncbi:DUF982 domain-containing protein [Neoaquamicrobium microcysteis]|jgi:hypothetical protein|nr:DUF982 domain-containing protein [Mesorhizobium microcysteis]